MERYDLNKDGIITLDEVFINNFLNFSFLNFLMHK